MIKERYSHDHQLVLGQLLYRSAEQKYQYYIIIPIFKKKDRVITILFYANFELSLKDTFPHKTEMELLRPWLFFCITLYKNASDSFYIEEEYDYSPSVYPLTAVLSFCNKESVETPEMIGIRADIYKLEARQLKQDGYFFEAQMIHISLFLIYFLKHNEKSMMFHLKKGIDLAYKHNLIYPVADAFPYYKTIFNKVLGDYPQEFSDRVRQCGLNID